MNKKIMELYKYIEVFNQAGVLKDEFEAFAEYEDVTTIEELLELCREELFYWAQDAEADGGGE